MEEMLICSGLVFWYVLGIFIVVLASYGILRWLERNFEQTKINTEKNIKKSAFIYLEGSMRK